MEIFSPRCQKSFSSQDAKKLFKPICKKALKAKMQKAFQAIIPVLKVCSKFIDIAHKFVPVQIHLDKQFLMKSFALASHLNAIELFFHLHWYKKREVRFKVHSKLPLRVFMPLISLACFVLVLLLTTIIFFYCYEWNKNVLTNFLYRDAGIMKTYSLIKWETTEMLRMIEMKRR